MKTGIASIWIVSLIIIFIFIFSAYIAITVDYSKSFALKNEVLNIIEKNKGMTDKVGGERKVSTVNPPKEMIVGAGTIQTINMYLAAHNYDATGSCPDDGNKWYGMKNLEYFSAGNWEEARKGEPYYYCFSKFNTGRDSQYKTIYYKVRFFYKFEIPVISEFLAVKVEGMTDEIYKPVTTDNFTENADSYFSAN